MYDKNDPRAALTTATSTAAVDPRTPIAEPEYFDFCALANIESSNLNARTVSMRGQNVVLTEVFLRTGDSTTLTTTVGELALIVTDTSPELILEWDGTERKVTEPGLIVAPIGDTRITAHGDGPVTVLVESKEPEWARRCVNAASYTDPHPRVTPATPWPEPVDGPRLRWYPLSEIPDTPARFGRIFRTRAFMVNFLPTYHGPRPADALSPHDHDDFEQLSLATLGSFTHHIRTPWGPDGTAWRDDEHVTLPSPSVVVIPPPTVHTSAAQESGDNILIDVFSPPRLDFSQRDGWVLNADEYPMP